MKNSSKFIFIAIIVISALSVPAIFDGKAYAATCYDIIPNCSGMVSITCPSLEQCDWQTVYPGCLHAYSCKAVTTCDCAALNCDAQDSCSMCRKYNYTCYAPACTCNYTMVTDDNCTSGCASGQCQNGSCKPVTAPKQCTENCSAKRVCSNCRETTYACDTSSGTCIKVQDNVVNNSCVSGCASGACEAGACKTATAPKQCTEDCSAKGGCKNCQRTSYVCDTTKGQCVLQSQTADDSCKTGCSTGVCNNGICQYGGVSGTEGGGITNPLKFDTFGDLIKSINSFVFAIAVAVAPVLFIIGGFMIVTAGGNAMKVQTAQRLILYTAIGLAVILLAQGIMAVIKNVLGVEEQTFLPLIFSGIMDFNLK